jgi:hypothetical protein
MKLALGFFFLVSSYLCFAQTFRFKNPNPCIFYNYENDKLCVIDDSTSIMMISLDNKKMIRRPLHLDKQITFKQLLTEYVPLSEKGSLIYFVDRGCGYVLQLRNDSIVRIDKSFHHQNQFGGAYFLNNGVPSIFGGYGLFSSKNFITQFDIISKEWSIADEGVNMPPSSFFPYTKDDDNLYVFLPNVKSFSRPINNNLWRFNFKNRKWTLEGKSDYTPSLYISSNSLNYFSYILEYDFNNNKIYRFSDGVNKSGFKFLKFKNKYVKLLSRENFNTLSSTLTIYDENDFRKQFLIGESDLIEKSVLQDRVHNYYYVVLLVFSLLFTFLLYLFLRKRKKQAPIYTMSESSIELLNLWVLKRHGVLELSDLNDLVNPEHLSIETMKKRREVLLKTFVFDMVNMFGLAPNEIYTETLNPMDKRMKVLTLNSKLMEIALKKGN